MIICINSRVYMLWRTRSSNNQHTMKSFGTIESKKVSKMQHIFVANYHHEILLSVQTIWALATMMATGNNIKATKIAAPTTPTIKAIDVTMREAQHYPERQFNIPKFIASHKSNRHKMKMCIIKFSTYWIRNSQLLSMATHSCNGYMEISN